MIEHICIGCGVVIYVTEKAHAYLGGNKTTICDDCFWEVTDLFNKYKDQKVLREKLQEMRIRIWKEQTLDN